MTIQHENHKFYLFDYFLDGHFFKSEEMIDEDLPRYGEQKSISSQKEGDINTQVVGTEQVSENEYRVFLNSLN